MIGKCPICGSTVDVKVVTEYQGEHPVGGYVDFIDEILPTCDCKWTDEQEQEIIDKAEPDEPDMDRYLDD